MLRTLETARKNERSILRSLAKRIVPEKNSKGYQRIIQNENQPESEIADFIKSHEVDQVFYQPDNLELALDYLAICANKEAVVEQVWRSLPNS